MTSKTDILIIGAGLSGLSAAWHLPKKYKVRIVESSDKCGGLATTEEIDGFRFDQTGHLLHLHNVYIKRWLQKDLFHDELLKIDKAKIKACANEFFSLEKGIELYDSVYKKALQVNP